MPPHLCFYLLISLSLLLSRPLPAYTRPVPSSSNRHNISHIKKYLQRFGYLPKPAKDAADFRTIDAEFESAVALYQSNHGLYITGRLDAATLAQISSPRCGVSDFVPKINNSGTAVSRYAYFQGQPRWTRPNPIRLTYAISPTDTIGYISRADMDAAVRRAFGRWARVIPVRFVPAADYDTADVKVGFYSGDHGDGEPFDGVLGVLAHAFSPDSGKLHLDGAERWAVDFDREDSRVAVDLESVVTHEIGHVLGLGHSAVKEAVMYPSLSPRSKKVELTVDDVEGVQALYGSNPNFNMTSILESETSDAAASMGRRLILSLAAVVVVGYLYT